MDDEGPIRLLIAEDHVVVRQGLRLILAGDPAIVVVAEATTGYEILSLVLQYRPDVLLLDLDLPGQGGLDALEGLRAHVPRPPRTLVLSSFTHEEYVRRARELGVAGFLSKGCDGEELRRAVRQVMRGVPVFDSEVAAVAGGQRYGGTGRFRRYADGSCALSAAERAVLRQMAGGDSYGDIAARLGRSLGTVRTQADRICEKLGAAGRQQAVLKALQLGILRVEGIQRPAGARNKRGAPDGGEVEEP